jgi:hypothetical protein
MIGSNSDWSAFKVWSPEPCKAINIYAHHDDLRMFAQLAISVPNRCKWLTSDCTHGQWTNTYKLVRGFWLTSLTIILFTRVAPRTKSKGFLIDAPHIFYYFQHTLCHVQKVRGLPIDAPHIFYYFQHALCRVQKVRVSIGMCSKFIILLIKFSKVFAAQQVSSSMVWLYPKPRERVS